MSGGISFTLFATILFCFGVTIVVADESLTVPAVLKGVLESRRAIRHAEAKIAIDEKMMIPRQQAQTANWHIWQSDEKRRAEQALGDGAVELTCFGCFQADAYVYYRPNPQSDPQTAATLGNARNLNPNLHRIPRLQWIGTLPSQVVVQHTMNPDSFFASSDPARERIETDSQSGDVSIEWKSPLGPECVGVVQPKFHHRIVSLVATATLPDMNMNLTEEIQCQYSDDSNTHPIPTSVTYVRKYNGDVAATEVTDITLVSVNKPLSDSPFSLKNVLKAGTPLSISLEGANPEGQGATIWNGDRIARESEIRNQSSLWRLIATFGGAAIVIAGLLIAFRRRNV